MAVEEDGSRTWAMPFGPLCPDASAGPRSTRSKKDYASSFRSDGLDRCGGPRLAERAAEHTPCPAIDGGPYPLTRRSVGAEKSVRVASRGFFIPSGLHGDSASLRATARRVDVSSR